MAALQFQRVKSRKVARNVSVVCNRQLISYRILFAFREICSFWEFYSPKVFQTDACFALHHLL